MTDISELNYTIEKLKAKLEALESTVDNLTALFEEQEVVMRSLRRRVYDNMAYGPGPSLRPQEPSRGPQISPFDLANGGISGYTVKR